MRIFWWVTAQSVLQQHFFLLFHQLFYLSVNITLTPVLVFPGKGRDEDDEREQQAVVKGMKKQLKYLVSQPVFKHAAKSRYPTQMGKLSLPNMPLATMESALSTVAMQKTTTELQPQQKKQKKKKRQRKWPRCNPVFKCPSVEMES